MKKITRILCISVFLLSTFLYSVFANNGSQNFFNSKLSSYSPELSLMSYLGSAYEEYSLSTSLAAMKATTNTYRDMNSNAFSADTFYKALFFDGAYCVPTYEYTGDYLSAIATTGAIQNITYTATTAPAGNYVDNSTQIIRQAPGLGFSFSTTYVGGSNGIKIWVDWNDDGVFDDATGSLERVFFLANTDATKTGSFVIPATTPLGTYRVRVRSVYGSSANPIPCGLASFGSTVDYSLEVIETPACLPPTALSGTALSLTSMQLGWTSTGNNFQVEWGAAGFTQGTGTTINNLTTTTTTVTTVVDTPYEFYVRRNCGADGFSYWSGPFAFKTGYCIPPYTYGCSSGAKISNFVTSGPFANISNNTGTSSCGVNGYNSFTAMTASSCVGVDIDFSVSVGSYSGGVKVWVDWNGNGEFEASELQYQSTGSVTSGTSVNGTIVVPAGTAIGNYRMRVRVVEGTATFGPCTSQSYGEVEDYTFAVIAAPACMPPSSLSATALSLTSVQLGWVSSGTDFQVQWGAAGFALGLGTQVNNLTTPTTTVSIMAETPYEFYVRRNCGVDGFSTWSGPFAFKTGYCIPTYINGCSSGSKVANFVTSGVFSNISNNTGTSSCGVDGYNDFSEMTVSSFAGLDVPFSVTVGSYSGGVKLWVDWNGNGEFETGELQYQSTSTVSSNSSVNGTMVVPAGTVPGDYRVRVRVVESYTVFGPCTSQSYGEVEDYTFTVLEVPACVYPLNVRVGSFGTTEAEIVWSNLAGQDRLGLEYYISTSDFGPGDSTPGEFLTGDVTSLALTDLTPDTTYYVWVRTKCTATEYSDWSDGVSFTTIPLGQIGTGTTSAGTLPLSSNYNYNYSQQIYLASEIGDVLGTEHYITSIRFYVESLPATTEESVGWKVYMGNTTQSAFSGTSAWVPSSQFSMVFNGDVTYPTVSGRWLTITLDTPFLWDGTSNLVVGVNESTTGKSAAPTMQFGTFSTGTAYRGMMIYTDANNPNTMSPQTASARYQYVNRIALASETAPTCIAVPTTTYSDLTISSVKLKWTNMAGYLGVEYYLSASNTPPTAATEPTASVEAPTLETVISDLQPDTPYFVWFKNVCSTTEDSGWSVHPLEFRTLVRGMIGVGETTNTQLPINSINNYNYSQQIYLQSELVAAFGGATPQYITSLRFHINNTAGTPANFKDWKILIGNTTKSAFASTAASEWVAVADLQQVFDGEVTFPSPTNDWMVITLTEPFIWDGTSNLVVAVNEYTPGWSSGANFRKHDVTTNRGRIYTQDGANFNFTSPASANSNQQYVPQVIFGTSAMPTCFPVSNVTLSDIGRFGVTAAWNLPYQNPAMGYQYEVRTAGAAGSGAVGLVLTGNVTVGLQAALAGLTPGTEYTVYIRSKCSETDFSPWRSSSLFTTLCGFPDVNVVTPGELCGVGTVRIETNVVGNGNAYWFENEQGGAPIHTGNNYVTEELEETTSFYVAGGTTAPDLEVVVGAGAATSSTYSNPFYSLWSNLNVQHLIRAEELIAAGISAGPITSVALDVTNAGTLPMLGLSVKIGTTAATELTTFANTDAFVEVYTNASLMPVLGINTLNFAAPFIWDGTSNIVLQFCHGNPASTTTMSRTVKFDPTSYKSTIKTHRTSNSSSEVVCGDTTTNLGTFEGRPQFIFNAVGLCLNPDREEVTVVVNDAPTFELSETALVLCAGTPSQSVTILEGADDYDVYVWTPATGVTGSAQTGWIFNPAETTEYTLRASSTTAGNLCRAKKVINVTVNPIPEASFTVTETDLIVCEGAVLPPFSIDVPGGLLVNTPLGTSRSLSGNSDNNTAFNNRWTSGKSQMLFLASELTDLGLIADGIVSAISFEIATLGSNATNPNYTIKIGTTDLTELGTSYVTTDLTTVFGPVTYTHTASGWQEIVFDTPYIWDGVSNLIIEISMNGANSANNSHTYYTETTNNTLLFSYNTSAPTRSKNRYNIKFKTGNDYVIEWTESPNLYVDEEATVLYDGETDVLNVYYKGHVEGYESITARVETALGCFIEKTYSIRTAFMTPPVVNTDQEFCGAIPITEVEIEGQEGAVFLWYASATAATPLAANYRITTTGTYYVTQKIGECVYPDRTAVSVLIKDKPIDPIVIGGVVCGGSLISEYAVDYNPNNTLHWYDEDNNEILNHNTPLATGRYFVSQKNTVCESNKVQIAIAVNPFPASPVSERQIFCGETRVSDIAVTLLPNGTANWYDSEGSVIRLQPNTIVRTGTYYVSQTVNGCDSQRVAVAVEAYDRVPAPNAQNQNYCTTGNVVGDLVVNGVINGATVHWYNVATGGNPLSGNQALNTGIYYVSQKVGLCESTRTRIGVNIVNNNTAPAAPVVQEFCGSASVSNLRATVATGMLVKWYAQETGGVALLGHVELTDGLYYVSQTIYGCESPRRGVRVAINEVPSRPTGQENQSFEVNDNARIVDLVLDQNNIVWFSSLSDAANDRNRLSSNMPLIDGYTYYAVAISDKGCMSEVFAVTVEITDPTMGVDDFDLSKLNYYPNPVVDILTVSYSETIREIEVYAMDGKLVRKERYDNQVIQIDMSNLASGNYIIKVLSNVNTQFIKVVKK